MKKLLLFFGLILSTTLSYSQKEAMTWYFGNQIRLNFTSNDPTNFNPSFMNARKGSFCMSDKVTGTPIFYSNGEILWRDTPTESTIVNNLYGNAQSLQPGISFPAPGTDNEYYIFTTGNVMHKGAFYTKIDMSLNSGLGGVSNGELNVQLPGIDSCQRVVMATKHANNKWYWVVYRTVGRVNKFYAYKVTEKGVDTVPVISDVCFTAHGSNDYAMSKFAPAMWNADGLLYCYTSANWKEEEKRTYEVYYFNLLSGYFNAEIMFKGLPDKPEGHGHLEHRSNGIEFSNDGRYLYSSIMALDPGPPQNPKQYITQYNMEKTNDPIVFMDNIRGVLEKNNIIDQFCGMQLGRNGKIYIAQDENKNNKHLSVIGYPYKKAADCAFTESGFSLNGRESTFGLPTIVPSFLSRFKYEGVCFPDSTYFESTFHPRPSRVTWDFGDGSAEVSGHIVVHKFPAPGPYLVKVTADYPREEKEVFEKYVFIGRTPIFDLGATISVCPGDSATIGVGLIPNTYYYWSNGVEGNVPQITVPAGTYKLRAEEMTYGCTHIDSIEIRKYLTPTTDNSAIDIFPATCTGPTGYIKGLVVNEQELGQTPFTYTWKDQFGNTVASTLNFDNAPPGDFTLYATDSHGCTWNVYTETVPSIGNAFISTVDSSGMFCGNKIGSIRFDPIDIMSGLLEYQITLDGTWSDFPWQTDSLFQGLYSGKYDVRARVARNQTCINPWGVISVGDYPKPTIDQKGIVPYAELDSLHNGWVDIPFVSPNFWYVIYDSLNNTNLTIQFDNPVFTGLTHGIVYKCYAYDASGCISDTGRFIIPWTISTHLISKVKGAPPVCKGENTFADLKVFNFEGIVDFNVVLNYDATRLTCLPTYQNLNPLLGSVNLDVSTPGRISITWTSPTPLTLPLTDTTLLLRLEFETKKAGEAPITWVFPPTDYIEGTGYNLKVTGLVPSKVIIYENPSLSISPFETCVGVPVTINANVNPPDSYSYLWTKPDGFTETGQQITINIPDTTHSGTYGLIVTNLNGCSATSSNSLIVHPLPAHGFTKDDSLYFDFPDVLEALPGFDSYLWMDGQTTQGIMIQDSGYYSVTVTDNHGCVNTFEIFANSNYAKPFFYRIPSAFTPNGDGLNDVFRPFTDYELIKKFQLVIYNRWGQMVFETDDSMKGWDGTVNGLNALPGPYGWAIVYSNYHKFNVKSKGIVWLVR